MELDTSLSASNDNDGLGIALPADLPSRHAAIERERQAGFPSLSPMQRKIAIDFVLTGTTIPALARELQIPPRHLIYMMGDPLLRAFIADLQKEYAAHRLIDSTWIETQILKAMPKLEGEETVPCVTRDGDEVMRHKYHAKELVSIFKHFGGNQDQKKMGGVHFTIDFGAMGVRMEADSDAGHTTIDVDPA